MLLLVVAVAEVVDTAVSASFSAENGFYATYGFDSACFILPDRIVVSNAVFTLCSILTPHCQDTDLTSSGC